MAFTGSVSNVLTPGQQSAVDGILGDAFQFVVNFVYSMVSSLLAFFTQDAVVGVLVVIAIVFVAWKMLKRRSVTP